MKKTILALVMACFCLMGATAAEAHDNRKNSRHDHHPPRAAVHHSKHKYVPVVRYYKPAPVRYYYYPQPVRYVPVYNHYYWFWR